MVLLQEGIMSRMGMLCHVVVAMVGLALGTISSSRADEPWQVREFFLDWLKPPVEQSDSHSSMKTKEQEKKEHKGTTHELVFAKDDRSIWITGGPYDRVARVTLDGQATFFPTGKGSHPHGIVVDPEGQVWVTLEGTGLVVRLDADGNINKEIDVQLRVAERSKPINTSPHGLALDADRKTLWFTGKQTNTVGKVHPDGRVEHFELGNVGAVPIYLSAGPDGAMWCTELVGNAIARITTEGNVEEYPIPTGNSRPIAILPSPDRRFMWFSEEAGNKVARVDMRPGIDKKKRITEYPVPLSQKNVILGGLAFDTNGNLWTQSYVNLADPCPDGGDYIIRIDKTIHDAPPGDISNIPVTYFKVPSTRTVMHRILQGPDRNIWFTELNADQLGRLTMGIKR
jgi:virginiamycin B lyase